MIENKLLIQELEKLNIKERINLIYSDIDSNFLKFNQLAIDQPFLFFELLGGDLTQVTPFSKWTPKYFFKEAKLDNEYDDDYIWDIANESLKRAKNEGNWFYTSEYFIEAELIKLKFEFSFTEGEIDEIISTPYLFFNFEDFIEITYLLD